MPQNKSDLKPIEPRQYQLELLEYVQERNAIIYLPTGAGKTYVAILAIKRYSQQMAEPITNGGKRGIFMCNTIELARQQATEMRKQLNLKIGLYTGERDVDNWKAAKWNEEITENQVLVGTAQIFFNLVTQNFIKITDMSIVIIDECHHATGGHPMREFMRLFQKADQTNLPRIIGLTGVLLKGNKFTDIRGELNNLEATFRGQIITVSTMEQYQNVMVYSTKPVEEIVRFSSAKYTFDLEKRIINEINECCRVVDNFSLGKIPTKLTKGLAGIREPNKKNYIKNMLKDFLYQMEEFGLYTAAIAIMSPIIDFELKKRQAETIPLRRLYRFIITKCEWIRHLLLKKFKDMQNDDGSGASINTLDIILNYSTPKLLSLLMYMKMKFAGKKPEDISCLIFVQRRYTAKCICYVMQKFIACTPELRNIIMPQFMVGRNSIAPGIECILDRKWNKSALEDFRKGDCNVIVCSNVLEEGIDVQSCNFVIALDELKTFNSYIQTKGRARNSGAIYAIFTPEIDEGKTIQQIKKYLQTHEAIKEFLIGRIIDRADPTEDEIASQFVDVIEPFVTPGGATLYASSALALVHRYCQMLPTDTFGLVAPWYCKLPLDKKNQILVSIKLPLQSKVKETIISNPMSSAKLAKVSAAFNACKKLYEQGELNEKLLPVTLRECIANVAEELFEHWKKYDEDVTAQKSGKQRRRPYERMYPEELNEAMPIAGQQCYAYEINFTPLFDSNGYNAHIVELMNTKTTYALLLNKRLPRLAEMPFYMNQGKVNIKISEQPIVCCISNECELQQLRKFHIMLFRDLLECWKSFFVMDKRNKENSYLLVPMRNQGIDWDLVHNFQRLSPHRRYSIAERQKKVYRPEDFLGKVVNKWYSDVEHDRYVVTKVHTDLTPMSAFGNTTYRSYAHFAESKYRDYISEVVQPNQFLIEVKQFTSRRNFFINAMGKKSDKDRGPIILIPELCHNFNYPGDMWLKALFLPSILHRLHYMLHADTLRRRINDFLGVEINANTSYQPMPLIVDTSLKRVVDNDGNAMEEIKEPKKLLSSLPTKQSESYFEIRTLTSEEGTWKDYLEPTDFSRVQNSLYPVELDYYHKFISGLVLDMEQLEIEDGKEWSSNQLNMVGPKKKNTKSALPGAGVNCAPILDVPIESRRRIEILERTIGNAPMTTAEQNEFVAAITTAGANDVFDMERFELLGDSFLKFSVSLYLVNKYPKWHEGFLTVIKSKLVSNRNLLYCMFELDIPKRICASLFKPRDEWLPPLVSVPNNLLELLEQNLPTLSNVSPADLYAMELSEDEIESGLCAPDQLERFVYSCNQSQELAAGNIEVNLDNDMNTFLYKEVMPDKVVADTLEALLGVCVKNYGIYSAFRMLEFFGVCKSDANNQLTNLLDLNLGSPLLCTNISTSDVDTFLINHEKLEENLGYKFRNRAYLLQALTHPSFPTNRLTGCYQELEFIGDAILDFLVSCYIFERNKNMTPGMLTDLRSALVNNITLGCVCVRHRFHLFLLAENAILSESIKNFADFQETQDHRVSYHTRILTEENSDKYDDYDDDKDIDDDVDDDVIMNQANNVQAKKSFNLSVDVDVPKTLGDIVEALIAAVYLDSRDLKITWNVVYHLLEQEFNQFSINVPKDAVRQLYEHKTADPKFAAPVLDEGVVMVKCAFTSLNKKIEVNGFGTNSKQAKKSAAKHALQLLAKHAN